MTRNEEMKALRRIAAMVRAAKIAADSESESESDEDNEQHWFERAYEAVEELDRARQHGKEKS